MPTTPPVPCEDDELTKEVEAALRGSTELVKLHTAAESLRTQPDRLLARIRFMREDPDLLEALASRSYRHANGFTKVKLVAKDGFSVRLHLWPASTTPRGDTNPHGHQWQFASWIVCGDGLLERFYTRSDVSDPAAQPYYRYRFPGGDAWYAEPVEQAWLTETQPLDRPTGTVYAGALGTVHTVAPKGDGFVATVVVQGPHGTDSIPVYALPGRCPRAYERPITATELYTELVALERAFEPLMRAKTLSPANDHVPWSSPDAALEDNSGASR